VVKKRTFSEAIEGED